MAQQENLCGFQRSLCFEILKVHSIVAVRIHQLAVHKLTPSTLNHTGEGGVDGPVQQHTVTGIGECQDADPNGFQRTVDIENVMCTDFPVVAALAPVNDCIEVTHIHFRAEHGITVDVMLHYLHNLFFHRRRAAKIHICGINADGVFIKALCAKLAHESGTSVPFHAVCTATVNDFVKIKNHLSPSFRFYLSYNLSMTSLIIPKLMLGLEIDVRIISVYSTAR